MQAGRCAHLSTSLWTSQTGQEQESVLTSPAWEGLHPYREGLPFKGPPLCPPPSHRVIAVPEQWSLGHGTPVQRSQCLGHLGTSLSPLGAPLQGQVLG
jgi:hypothetical protein